MSVYFTITPFNGNNVELGYLLNTIVSAELNSDEEEVSFRQVNLINTSWSPNSYDLFVVAPTEEIQISVIEEITTKFHEILELSYGFPIYEIDFDDHHLKEEFSELHLYLKEKYTNFKKIEPFSTLEPIYKFDI